LLAERVALEPVLVQISAAKRLRDAAERAAREVGEDRVTLQRMRVVAGLPTETVDA
jgi:chlorophyllide a reductase subunit Z